MTLDEAIKRYTDNAEYERTHGNLQGCLDFRQLAEWLSELKQFRGQTRSNIDGTFIISAEEPVESEDKE